MLSLFEQFEDMIRSTVLIEVWIDSLPDNSVEPNHEWFIMVDEFCDKHEITSDYFIDEFL